MEKSQEREGGKRKERDPETKDGSKDMVSAGNILTQSSKKRMKPDDAHNPSTVIINNDNIRYSNNMKDTVMTICQICRVRQNFTKMRSHTKSLHGVSITDYKKQYGQLIDHIVEFIYHKCGICSKALLLDGDTLAVHAKTHGITHKMYSEKFITLRTQEGKNHIRNIQVSRYKNVEIPPELIVTLSREIIQVAKETARSKVISKPEKYPETKKAQESGYTFETPHTPHTADDDINILLESSDDPDIADINFLQEFSEDSYVPHLESLSPHSPESPDTPDTLDTAEIPGTPYTLDTPGTTETHKTPGTPATPDTADKTDTADTPDTDDKPDTADKPQASKTRSIPEVKYKGVPGFERADKLLAELYALLNSR